MINRRQYLTLFSLSIFATATSSSDQKQPIIKPLHLEAGDTVGLINPATYSDAKTIEEIKEILSQLGLKIKLGKHLFTRYGYLAGVDQQRAADVNEMFKDSTVKAILAVEGGWGCNRILPLLDYELIKKNPKIILGYSDLTGLLLGIYSQTKMITFHGPLGGSVWNNFSQYWLKSILFNREQVTLKNTIEGLKESEPIAQKALVIQTITPGKARGKLVGGNLSVLCSLVGTKYLPDWQQVILFVEEISEEVYRIDRLLTQLKLAGILGTISGFIFGQCTKCEPENPLESLSLEQVLSDIIKPLGVPAWYGAALGHIENKFTLPVGLEVEIDATLGTIRFLESAVL